MTWLQPWGWLGLGALAVPILVHLFSRRPARTETFPSLRFLVATELRPTRRTRISDWPLLLVRLAVLLAAVIALAQPTRRRAMMAGDGVVSRVRVVDTLTVDAAAVPRDSVETIATASLSDGLTQALARLRDMPAPRQLDVRSTFAASVADSAMFSRVPRDVQLRLTPTPARAPGVAARGDSIVWSTTMSREAVATVVRAAAQLGGPPVRVQVASATSGERISRRVPANPGNVVRRVAQDPALLALRAPGDRLSLTAHGDSLSLHIGVARSDLALAAMLALGGADTPRPVLPPRDAATLSRWAALGQGPSIGAGSVVSDVHRVTTDARWVWLVVLLLLGVEWRMRRRTRREDGVRA